MTDIFDTPHLDQAFASQIAAWMMKGGFAPGQTIKWSYATSINLAELSYGEGKAAEDYFNVGSAPLLTPFSDAERGVAGEIFKLFSQVANIKFEYVADPSTADLQLGYASLKDGVVAGAKIPTLNGTATYLLVDDQYDLNLGGYGYTTLIHEIGHALGLDHPDPMGGGIFPEANKAFSVMAYTEYGPHGENFGITPLLLGT